MAKVLLNSGINAQKLFVAFFNLILVWFGLILSNLGPMNTENITWIQNGVNGFRNLLCTHFATYQQIHLLLQAICKVLYIVILGDIGNLEIYVRVQSRWRIGRNNDGRQSGWVGGAKSQQTGPANAAGWRRMLFWSRISWSMTECKWYARYHTTHGRHSRIKLNDG